MNKEFDVYNQKRGVKLQIGDEFKTLDGCDVKVIEVLNAGSCVIQFQDEYKHEMTVVSNNLRRGAVKNPWTRWLGGSYIGYGKYSRKDNTQAHSVWRNIITRCYSTNRGKPSKAYDGCSVSEEWLCFQNFCEWYENHEDYGKGWHIDKDIKYKGNKVYSAETCIMVPPEINSLFRGAGESKVGFGLRTTDGVRYFASLKFMSLRLPLGSTSCVESGEELTKFCKEEYIDHLTQTTYKDILSEEVKSYMRRFRF